MKTRAMVLAFAALAGCAEEPQTGAGLYAGYCASCHGADARGGDEALNGKVPPDLTGLAKRHKGVFPEAYLMSTIDGYARVQTHGAMPIFGALLEGDIETWTGPDGVPTPTPVSLILLNDYLAGLQVE